MKVSENLPEIISISIKFGQIVKPQWYFSSFSSHLYHFFRWTFDQLLTTHPWLTPAWDPQRTHSADVQYHVLSMSIEYVSTLRQEDEPNGTWRRGQHWIGGCVATRSEMLKSEDDRLITGWRACTCGSIVVRFDSDTTGAYTSLSSSPTFPLCRPLFQNRRTWSAVNMWILFTVHVRYSSFGGAIHWVRHLSDLREH
jgi:hypothetical protein